MRITKALLVSVLATASLLLRPADSAAIPINFSWNTSSLTTPGTYSLDFQLTDGGDGPTGNFAIVSNVVITGGSLLGTQFYPDTGTVIGGIPPVLILTDASSFSSYTRDFIPGTQVSFTLDLSNVGPTVPFFPDEFVFAILRDGIEVATTDPVGTNKLLRADYVGGAAPAIESYELIGGSAAVPEPGSLVLLGSGLLVGVARLRRRRK